MGWLGRKRTPHEAEDEEQPRESRKPLAPLAPVLNVLVPDIAGVTSFHLRQFYDPDEAREFVGALPSTAGLHAFWGLHAPPAGHVSGEGPSEAMVLIRSAETSDTVYVVSFVDLESADAFARFEAKRGMNLGLFLIYWAEIVEIEVSEDGVRLTPEVPPRAGLLTPRFAEPVSPAAGEPAAPVVESPAPPAPVPDTLVPAQEAPPAVKGEAEWTFVSEPQREAVAPAPDRIAAEEVQAEPAPAKPEVPVRPEPEPAAGTAFKVEAAFVAKPPEPEAAPQAPVETEPVSTAPLEAAFARVPDEPPPLAQAPVEGAPERERVQDDIPAGRGGGSADGEEDIDIEREAIEFLKASGNGKQATQEADPWQPAGVPPAYAAETYREEPAARNTLEATPPAQANGEFATVSAPVRALAAAADEAPAEDEEVSENRVQEVEKILNVKRWDKKESPFQGFDSPPGRF